MDIKSLAEKLKTLGTDELAMLQAELLETAGKVLIIVEQSILNRPTALNTTSLEDDPSLPSNFTGDGGGLPPDPTHPKP